MQKGKCAAGRERGQDMSLAERNQGGWSGAGTPNTDSHGHCSSLLRAVSETALGQRQLNLRGWVPQSAQLC